jgi:hypothetical protein
MRNQILWVSVIIACALSCEKDSSPTTSFQQANAEIIAFRAEKCGCCWGWVIRIMDADTIKADSLPNAEVIGYDIVTPILVYIELAEMKQDCSALSLADPIIRKSYYRIKKLEVIQ